MATPGDLTNYFLAGIKAEMKLDSLSATDYPTSDQCVAACNSAVRDMVERFAYREFGDNRRSTGRKDLLTRQLVYEPETGAAGFCEWPIGGSHVRTPDIVSIYLVEVSGVPAVKVNSEDIKNFASGPFAATTSNPVYAEGFGPAAGPLYKGIYYLPATGTPVIGYHFVKMPALLAINVTDTDYEDWPLDDDLRPAGLFKALSIIMQASPEPVTRRVGALFGSWYETMMNVYLNPLSQQPSKEIV
jgi:hypothetical protein